MFRLSDDERTELRNTARHLLADRSASLHVRKLLESEAGYDPDLWSSIAELGWIAIPIAEDFGGMGATFTDFAVILQELGRQLTPSPIISSVVAARALQSSQNEALAGEFLPALAAGDTVLAVALSAASGTYDVSQLTVGVGVDTNGLVFNGTSRFVIDADVADAIVVAGVGDDDHVRMAVVDASAPGVRIEVEPTFDRTRRLAKVTFDNVGVDEARVLGTPGSGVEFYGDLVSVGAIAVMCDAVGAAERILEMSNEYAKERFQFNRPIGSFQAVKHHLANMFTDVEASRAAAQFAVDTLDSGGDLRHAAAIAKSFAGPACARVGALAVQVHGGIGFTWEHDAHLYLKRVRLDEALFGTSKWHRQYLADLLVDQQLAMP